MTTQFTLSPVDISLPQGAFVGGGRDVLRFGEQPLCAFTRGRFRPCLHPVWTPSGHIVTAEQPADHPHHRGIWCASDHVGHMMQGPDGVERYEYNFYVDDVFQGRAPGRIRQTGLRLAAQSKSKALVEQKLYWIGPVEWGAPDGRHVLTEFRWTVVSISECALILDITSQLTPAGNIPVSIGPTRHAWFNARLADGIVIDPESAPVNDSGERGGDAIPSRGTSWVDYSGPVGGAAKAGLTVFPKEPNGSAWFVADWGVITVGSVRDQASTLEPGDQARFSCRFVAHDGTAPEKYTFAKLPFVIPENMLREEENGS